MPGPAERVSPRPPTRPIFSTNSSSSVSLNLDADESVQTFFLEGEPSGPVVLNQSAFTLQLSQNLNLAGGDFGVTYNQSGGTVSVGGMLLLAGPANYNLSGGTLTAASAINNSTITISNGATLNISSISGSGTVQYASNAAIAGGAVSVPITTAANTTITKTTGAAAIISGTQTYGANTTYEADDGPTTFQSPTGSSFAAANLSIHGNTTKITFDIPPDTSGATPQIRPTYVKGIIFNTPGEGILAAGGQQVLGADNLSIDVSDGGSMDVNDNTFLYESSTADHNAANMAQLTSYLHTGFNGGAWNGLGIFSTVASQNFGRSVGLLNNDDGSGNAINSSFHTAPVDAHTVLVQYTFAGDTNLDGVDTQPDFTNWLNGFQNGGTTWAAGDFTYDGTVDINNDFRQLADGWEAEYGNEIGLSFLVDTSSLTADQKAQAELIIANVPEPTAAAMLILASSAILRRRRSAVY